ncbi:MAG: hypothetical protein FWF15_08530, partial [Oscillospiraceae bacterium]|nr:hypothetical protein [Oscillospiraceae bacterium]
MIQTVLGAISKDALGITTSHEHILLDLTTFFTKHPVPGISDPESEPVTIENLGILYRDPYALYDNLKYDDYETQKQELVYFKNAGGKTVFDATCSGLGRDPQALKRMAEETGLNIICGTGYYVSSTYSDELKNMPAADIADTMLNELNVGMDGTDIRAGYIGEIGISENMDVHERKILKAAAIAQTKSGVALSVHINPWTQNGLEAADIALAEGVRPDKIIICHMDVENNEDYIL